MILGGRMRGQSAPLKNAVAWRDERGNIHIASTVNGKRVVSLIGADSNGVRRDTNLYNKLSKATG